jgi:hypothetical protein
MPVRQVPTSYTARKKVTLGGAVYVPGDVVPLAVVKVQPNLSALVSNRTLVPNVDPHQRKKSKLGTPTPTDYPASVRKVM